MYVRNNRQYSPSYSATLTRELKISYTSEILSSVFTHWYWSMITVTSDSRIRPIATVPITPSTPIPILV